MRHATPLHNRGSLADSRPIMHRFALPGHGHDEGDSQVHTRVVSTVKWPLEQALDAEMTNSLGCDRYERGRRPRRPEATRSGTYERE